MQKYIHISHNICAFVLPLTTQVWKKNTQPHTIDEIIQNIREKTTHKTCFLQNS